MVVSCQPVKGVIVCEVISSQHCHTVFKDHCHAVRSTVRQCGSANMEKHTNCTLG